MPFLATPRPKSAILNWASDVTRMLAALRSPWIKSCRWMCARPEAICNGPSQLHEQRKHVHFKRYNRYQVQQMALILITIRKRGKEYNLK